MTENKKDINEIFKRGNEIDEALKKGVREALLQHKRAGNSVVIWKDGKVVLVPPERNSC